MDEKKPLRIELVTSGGFTGRGIGSIRIDGTSATADGIIATELTAAEEARLHRLPILGKTRSPSKKPDAIVYTLTIDGHRWTWNEAAAPPDFASWADALLAIRERVLGKTPSSM